MKARHLHLVEDVKLTPTYLPACLPTTSDGNRAHQTETDDVGDLGECTAGK